MFTATFTRPTWAEVSLAALRHNYRLLRDSLPAGSASLMPVVKADAYGHGAPECARALQQEGAEWFAVTSASEGLALRFAGIAGRILLLSGFFPGEERKLIEQQLTPAVWEHAHLEALEAAAGEQHARKTFKSVQTGQPIKIRVHLKVDTGMGRLGVLLADLPRLLDHLRGLRHIELEGLFSHYASGEIIDSPQTQLQQRRFAEALNVVRDAGFRPGWTHLANSAGMICHPQNFSIGRQLVRPGIALYGYSLPIVTTSGKLASGANPTQAAVAAGLQPALSWKSRIVQIKHFAAGEPLGYNATYVTGRASTIAALAVGYADGLNRLLSNKGRVIVRDSYAPIVGRVSMDVTLIDVTDIPGAAVGDEAVLIGQSRACRIDAWEHASHCGTIPYEILCNISKRVPRVYME